ncbi:MFS transporter [Aeromonas salmonicida]|uniref:MFS transporter n=2 Tax=Aeromonas salmonicida TaxID=645 RepID=A0AAX1PPD6_AERSA|nr:MFS transporter [Aeromonas salmonicida]
MIMPCVLGTILRTFEEENERAMALGLWGMVSAAGAALGPLIGGVLLAHFWWGSAFLINVPVMLIVLALVYDIKTAVGATHSPGMALAAELGGARRSSQG